MRTNIRTSQLLAMGGYALPSVPLGPYRNHYISSVRPLFDPDDEGGGGGGDEGDSGYAPVELDDESAEPDATTGLRPKIKALGFKNGEQMVMLPGAKKPIALKDLADAYSARDRHTAGLKTMGEIAAALKKQQEQGGGAGEKRTVKAAGTEKLSKGEIKSAIDRLEDMDLLDGKSAAAAMREFSDGTVTPLIKAVVQMAKEMKEMKGSLGGFQQRDGEANFSTEISGAIESLKLPRVGGKPIEGEDILKEITRDLFFSYAEEDQPKLKGETLQKLVKERVTAILKFAKAYQKAELESGRLRMREQRFARPGAGVAPSGKPRKVLSNRAAAEMLFAGSGDNA